MRARAERIASLLPAATEWLAELGLGDAIVGVSHECDFPEDAVRGKPRLTRARVDPEAPASEVDRRVRELLASGEDLYLVLEDELARISPDLIVTQAQCDVCAVSEDQVRRIVSRLSPAPEVVVLGGSTLDGVVGDVLALARVAGAESAGPGAVRRLSNGLKELERTAATLAGGGPRPRCALLEWIDPPMTAGSWLPELTRAAGLDGFGGDAAGKKSERTSWEEIARWDPEVVVFAPCGFSVERAERDARALLEDPRSSPLGKTTAFARGAVFAVDGNGLFNRPGPRLLDSAKLLHAIARFPGELASFSAWVRPVVERSASGA
ncbi:ABC transporter substrate-binding protein [bacterium]|nr:ABC transporter substrate-binding protein [bacterium]